MDDKRSARRIRAILQVAKLLEDGDIRAWVGGGYALLALDRPHRLEQKTVDFYIYADAASATRMLLAEDGFGIVDVMPNSFAAVRGGLALKFTFLWLNEQGEIITYDETLESIYSWQSDAFPKEKNGRLLETWVYAMNLPERSQGQPAPATKAVRPEQKTGATKKLKSLVHDRM